LQRDREGPFACGQFVQAGIVRSEERSATAQLAGDHVSAAKAVHDPEEGEFDVRGTMPWSGLIGRRCRAARRVTRVMLVHIANKDAIDRWQALTFLLDLVC
jgi:hypothetical protein